MPKPRLARTRALFKRVVGSKVVRTVRHGTANALEAWSKRRIANAHTRSALSHYEARVSNQQRVADAEFDYARSEASRARRVEARHTTGWIGKLKKRVRGP